MKGRMYEFEGQPEEVVAAMKALQDEGFRARSIPPTRTSETNGGRASELPVELTDWLDAKKSPLDRRRWVEALLSELLAGGDVRIKVGASSKNADGLANKGSLYKIGKKGAAFGYLGYKGRLWLRLPKNTDLEGFSNAQPRDVNPPHDHYGLVVILESQDGVTEAIKLSRLAMDRP